MAFHPSELDQAQLKRMAKNLKRGSEAVLPQHPLTLAQSQELIARALGHRDWHDANQPRTSNTPVPRDPLEDPQQRLSLLGDLFTLMELGFPFNDAVARVASTYRRHAINDMAQVLDGWHEELKSQDNWMQYLSLVLARYNPRHGVMFDLFSLSTSGSHAMDRIISHMRKELNTDRPTAVVNNLASSVPAG